MRTIHVTLSGLTAATAALTALALAPMARADDDSDYLETLASYGVTGNPTGSIAWGHQICDYVGHGIPPLVEANQLHENSPQLTQLQTFEVVDTALTAYCIQLPEGRPSLLIPLS